MKMKNNQKKKNSSKQVVEKILQSKFAKNGESKYLVKWESYGDEFNSWETASVLSRISPGKVRDYISTTKTAPTSISDLLSQRKSKLEASHRESMIKMRFTRNLGLTVFTRIVKGNEIRNRLDENKEQRFKSISWELKEGESLFEYSLRIRKYVDEISFWEQELKRREKKWAKEEAKLFGIEVQRFIMLNTSLEVKQINKMEIIMTNYLRYSKMQKMITTLKSSEAGAQLRKLQNAIKALIDSEKAYNTSLKLCRKMFYLPLRKQMRLEKKRHLRQQRRFSRFISLFQKRINALEPVFKTNQNRIS